jgi:pimeloyl-ACP methyl ester carboxylesterase
MKTIRAERSSVGVVESISQPTLINRNITPRTARPSPAAPAAQTPMPITRRAMQQQIRFCTSSDGIRLAYATVGEGPALVKAANWLSHLEFDWTSPVWRHWLMDLSQDHTLVRYDERGCGLSDRNVNDFSLDAWVLDLETVVDALGLDRFPLFGMSRGSPIAIAYTARHPERVSHLILYGGFVHGRLRRNVSPKQKEEAEVMHQLIRIGWGQENPAFRQVFTSMFLPEGTPEQLHAFNELQRASTSPEIAARIVGASHQIDVTDLAAKLDVPTLVLHANGDLRVPFEEGRLAAALIPNAQFVALDSRNHILLESEPAWQRFIDEVRRFLRTESGTGTSPSSRIAAPSGIRSSPTTTAAHPARRSAEQRVRFCVAPDGVRIAYAVLGEGPLLIKAGNSLTHMEYDRHSPVWRHWWDALARQHTLVRYDERGGGLSDWNVSNLSMDTWVSDLETVADEFGSERFALLGVSQGASVSIAYAVRHPERISHLILYGGYARGRFHLDPAPERIEEANTLIDLIRVGWGQDNPAFRKVFATLFMPEGTPEQIDWYTELARVTATPENAAMMETAFFNIDVTHLAPHVKVPTLILHARNDAMCPFEEGRLMAALIPGARFIPLESNNHILLETEPAWQQFLTEVHAFLQTASTPSDSAV